MEILSSEPMNYAPEKLTAHESYIDVKIDAENEVSAINAAFINGGVSLMGAVKLESKLEDIFIELTGGGGGQIA